MGERSAGRRGVLHCCGPAMRTFVGHPTGVRRSESCVSCAPPTSEESEQAHMPVVCRLRCRVQEYADSQPSATLAPFDRGAEVSSPAMVVVQRSPGVTKGSRRAMDGKDM